MLKYIAITVVFVFMVPVPVLADISAEPSERGVIVKMDGELFTEYLTKAGQAPAMWPVIGPTGKPMTRSYPAGPTQKGETRDHPHHQSVWFTHDQVNGVDFWKANVNAAAGDSDPGPKQGPHIAHRVFTEVESNGQTARIVTRNDWMNGEQRICEDERTTVCGVRENGDRWIDFTITIHATDGDVTFGDTKEGTFAVRVADTMRVEAKRGGRIINSAGQVDDDAWGLPARWVDYTGPVDAVAGVSDPSHKAVVGIAMMSHPTSFRPVPRWHVRGYGLFAANPFGQRDFPQPDAAEQGAVTIKGGDSLTLRYRLLLHRGTTESADIDAAFAEFAAN
ncbi:MAG: PmoA family protein [Pirellulales bacterium]